MTPNNISPEKLYERILSGERVNLVDVRSPQEYAVVHAVPAHCVPLDMLTKEAVLEKSAGIPDAPVYMICKSGGRSRTACAMLMQQGLRNVVNVEGGTAAWERAGLPVEKNAIDRHTNWVRAGGLLAVAASVLLGTAVSPYFFWLAGAIWVGLVLTGNSPCCSSGACSPRMSR